MAESCCGPSGGSCGTPQDEYDYGRQMFETGTVDTAAGAVPRVASRLSTADLLGRVRVRWNLGRMHFRVRPGLYAVGDPDDTSPVFATANYKLSFDALRSTLDGRDAWVLVCDTRGINVWCAAGKGTFSTDEVVRRVNASGLAQVVSHQRIVLPQLAAPGVAAHGVREATGFRVAWGPVRVRDLPAFIDAGMKATKEMRRVTFGLADRATLVPVELSVMWQPRVLAVAAAWFVLRGFQGGAWTLDTALRRGGWAVLLAATAVVAGLAITPLLLPWLPGRSLSLKGAIAGLLASLGLLAAYPGAADPASAVSAVLLVTAAASFAAMNFTGATTYTSPSGVEREMRRALPLQIGGAASGLLVGVGAMLLGRLS